MKKSINLKLIVFSLLLVAAGVSYSAPVFQAGTGVDSTVAGDRNIASNLKSSAFGNRNKASGGEDSAFGQWNEAAGGQSSAFGHGNLTNGFASSAFGYGNRADKEGSSAFGYNNTASEKFSSAFGTQNEANGEKSSVFGNQYKVTGEASGAFGRGKTTWNGTTGKDDYDYVNEGKDSYMIGNYNRIASGSNNNFILGNNVSIGPGIQNSVALGNGSTVSSSNEVSVGSRGKERKITNVADGEVSATSTDAVTGKQLYNGDGINASAWRAKLGIGSADVENLRNEVNEKIDNVKDEVRDVGSLSAALAGLHPMQYDPKAPAQVMAALGHYKNKQAIAVGASYHFNDKFMVSTGVALSGEKRTETMANVGFTVKLGKGSGVSYNETPQYVVQNEVKRLTVENQDLKSKINNQDNRIKEQDEKIKNLEEKLNRLLKIK
ncbi:YadA-like family protein [Fusobacterium nucleatum]|uniref:YadA-like family protein n=1 Tax=Fusobacterium nucleatum TaxID=851 RepID=UPI0030CFBEE4